MYKIISLDLARGGDREVSLLTTGRTSYYYHKIFGQDPMKSLGVITKVVTGNTGSDTDMMVNLLGSGEMDSVSQLAFIMNAQAEGKEMNKLNLDSYLDWVDQFEPMAVIYKAADIVSMYFESRAGSADLKKSQGQQTGK